MDCEGVNVAGKDSNIENDEDAEDKGSREEKLIMI